MKTLLLGNELCEKVHITLSIVFSVRVFKPGWIIYKIEVSDVIDVGAK